MKFAYRNREFWCKGYYVDTVGKNTKAIKEYISEQLKRDQESDQLSMFDPRDPFTGSKKQLHGWQANLQRTCAQPIMSRALPENEIPPAMRVDFYYFIAAMSSRISISHNSRSFVQGITAHASA